MLCQIVSLEKIWGATLYSNTQWYKEGWDVPVLCWKLLFLPLTANAVSVEEFPLHEYNIPLLMKVKREVPAYSCRNFWYISWPCHDFSLAFSSPLSKVSIFISLLDMSLVEMLFFRGKISAGHVPSSPHFVPKGILKPEIAYIQSKTIQATALLGFLFGVNAWASKLFLG